MIKGQHVRNAVGAAHLGGRIGGRVTTGLCMIGLGGLGALLYGSVIGGVEITKEVFEQPALPEGDPTIIDAQYRVEK